MPPGADDDPNPLIALFRQCVVCVTDESGQFLGSGFFVAPGRVVTCGHVIHGTGGLHVRWQKRVAAVNVAAAVPPLASVSDPRTYPLPDLAVLSAGEAADWGHPCAALSQQQPVLGGAWDGLYLAGYTVEHGPVPALTGATAEFESLVTEDAHTFFKLKRGLLLPGFSGSPLLDVEAGLVTGIIESSRGRSADLGGFAVPAAELAVAFPDVLDANRAFHDGDDRWEDAAQAEKERAKERKSGMLGPVSPLDEPYLDLPEDSPDCWLLNPRYGIVPFLDTGSVLPELVSWCDEERLFSIGFLHGEGGRGKSRLATELCSRMRECGWEAGIGKLKADESVWEGFRPSRPALVVFDYAEPAVAIIARVATLLHSRPGKHRVRILLVARFLGAWMKELQTETAYLASGQGPQWQVGELPSTDSRERDLHAREAMTAFSARLGLAPRPVPDVSSSAFATPLLVHIQVLLQIRDDQAAPRRQQLLSRIVDREETRWLAARERYQLGSLTRNTAMEVIAVATLLTPSWEDTHSLLAALPELADASLRHRVIDWLREVLPGEGSVSPLSPDLIVEELLSRVRDLGQLTEKLCEHPEFLRYRDRLIETLRIAADGNKDIAEEFQRLQYARPELARDADTAQQESGEYTANDTRTGNPFLVAADLRAVTHSKVRLSGMSFVQQENTLLAILGPSGAGKSSLLAVLLGELPLQYGQLFVQGLPVATHAQQIRQKIAFVPQRFDLHMSLTVEATLRYGFGLRSSNRAERDAAVGHVLRLVRMEGLERYLLSTLSGAQLRRVSIALELLGSPSLLLVDEPTSGLEANQDREIMGFLREYAEWGDPKEPGKSRAVIVVTHASEQLALAHQVLLVVDEGTPAYSGPPRNLRRAFQFGSYADLISMLMADPRKWAAQYQAGSARQQALAEAKSLTQRSASEVSGLARKLVGSRPRSPRDALAKLDVLVRRQVMLLGTQALTKNDPGPLDVVKNAAAVLLPLIIAASSAALAALVASAPGLGGVKPTGAGPTSLTLLSTLCILSGQALTYSDVVNELKIIEREYRAGVRPLSVLLSKWLVYAVFAIAQAGVITVVYCLIPNRAPIQSLFGGPELNLFASLSALTVVAMTLGLLVSAVAGKLEHAVAMVTGISIAQIALNGVTSNLSKGGPVTVVSELLPDRWGLAAAASSVDLRGIGGRNVSPDLLWDHTSSQWLFDMSALATLCILYFALAACRLHVRIRLPKPHRLRNLHTAN